MFQVAILNILQKKKVLPNLLMKNQLNNLLSNHRNQSDFQVRNSISEIVWKESIQPLTTSHLKLKTLLKVDMPLCSSHLLPKQVHFTLFMKILLTFKNYTKTVNPSSCSLRMLELELKRSEFSMKLWLEWENSTLSLLSSLKFWLKTKD